MTDLELRRTPHDRRVYEIDGVGTLRHDGFGSRRPPAEAREGSWQITRSGLLRRVVEAADAAGSPVGRFEAHGLRRGGTLRWSEREFTLRAASMWRERYALADGERELVVLDGKGWGKKPVKLTVEDVDEVDPGLLLFAAFVVRGLAEDSASNSGSASFSSY
jgi:hypothetical protein